MNSHVFRFWRAVCTLVISLALPGSFTQAAEQQDAHVPDQAEGAQRVVSTDAAITGIVIALGAGERLVAVDDSSELPAAYADLPRLGYHRALSAEGLLSLQPDLLLASEHAGPATAIAPLEAAGATVQRLPSAYDLQTLEDNVRRIAASLNRDAAGAALVSQLRARAARIRSQTPDESPRTVLLRESNGELRVAGAESAGHALLQLLGVRNAVDFRGYRSFSEEGLLALDPELLVVVDPALPDAPQWLERYPLLRFSRAGAQQAVFSVDSAALVGGLSLDALSEAERLLEAMGGLQRARVARP